MSGEGVRARFASEINKGFKRRFSCVMDNKYLVAAQGLLNTLSCQISPHLYETNCNFEDLAVLFGMSEATTEVGVRKLLELVFITSRKLGRKDLPVALRKILVSKDLYSNLPQVMIHGFLKILCIATSEAIAETQGSMIDKLHLRYCNTDIDDNRVQRELKVKLMGPAPGTPDGERFVLQIAKILASKHSFLNQSGKMGVALQIKMAQK